jgi:cytidine deaminase
VADNAALKQGPELVIALVGAIGTDLSIVERELHQHLAAVSYNTVPVSLIELVRPYVDTPAFDDPHVLERYMARMDAGDEFRRDLGRPDAIALLAIAAIREQRSKRTGDEKKPLPRHEFLLKSLKNPSEVETLRSTYGKNCLIISAYGPEPQREKRLAERIAASVLDADVERHRSSAQRLIYRDDIELGVTHGQNVRDTFPLADAFVDASSIVKVDEGVSRIVDLLFGHPHATPTRVEYGMFHAQGAALRSADAGRQVGAAIMTCDGDVLALGSNEVAKPLGGQYWG